MAGKTIGIWCLGGDRFQRDRLISFLDGFRKNLAGNSILIVGSWRDRARFRTVLGKDGISFQSVPGSLLWTLRAKLDSFWQKTEEGFGRRNQKISRIPLKVDNLFGLVAKTDQVWSLPIRVFVGILVWVLVGFVGVIHSFCYYALFISKILAFVLKEFDDPYILNCSRKFLGQSSCQSWVIPELSMIFPWGQRVRHVLFLDGEPWRASQGPFDEQHVQLLKKAIPGQPSDLGLYAIRSPDSRSWLRHYQGSPLLMDRLRWIPEDCRKPDSTFYRDLLKIVDEVVSLPDSVGAWDIQAGRRQPNPGELHVHLFLPQAFRGGVWEALITLIHGLMNCRDQKVPVKFSLSLPMGQTGLEQLAEFGNELPIEHYSYQVFPKNQAGDLLEAVSRRGGAIPPGDHFALLSSPLAMKADVWFALADRFALPFLPVKPFGVIVYDVIQKYLPELFPRDFFEDLQPSMTLTMKIADRVLTTSDVTRKDVIDLYELDPEKVGLVQVACEPALRFEGVTTQKVRVPDGFILNVTNPTPHKGLEVMMRAYAILRKAKGHGVPPLVVCGSFTEKVIPVPGVSEPNPVFRRLQELVGELDLQLGVDFFVLGLITEGQLLDLYQRCSIVVNAARYDNGTYSLIEGNYFGKKLISTDYPAARWLYERFEVPVRYFRMLDSFDLSQHLGEALAEPQATPQEIQNFRKKLANPKHGYARYAEQVYDCLLGLGNRTGGS